MRRFQEEGKVRHLGLSEASVKQIERARGVVTVVSVQNKYNLADREWEKEVGYCQREKIGFIPWFPLQVGKLAEDETVTHVARTLGATASQVALAWLLQRSPVMLPIPGTSKLSHLEENVGAAGLELAAEQLESLSRLSPPPAPPAAGGDRKPSSSPARR
jgi:aryl-alcohol dehydrogenase-like predicted oxidoreductase